MSYQVNITTDSIEVAISGPFSQNDIEAINQRVSESIGSGRNCILDFSQCDFIDSMGIGFLNLISTRLSDAGAELKIKQVNGQPAKVMQLCQLHAVVDVQYRD